MSPEVLGEDVKEEVKEEVKMKKSGSIDTTYVATRCYEREQKLRVLPIYH